MHVGVLYKYNSMNYYFQVSSNKMEDGSRTKAHYIMVIFYKYNLHFSFTFK